MTVLGFDLVDVDEIRRAIESQGARYLARIYTDEERRRCHDSPRLLAAVFAAKEATLKVIRGDDEAIPWLSINVRLNASGAPAIELTGSAATCARALEISQLSVSFATGAHSAAALVLAEQG